MVQRKKMKHLLIILAIISLMNCKVQKLPNNQEITINSLEPGKCYFTLQLENETEKENNIFQKSFTLEIIPTKYKKIETNYSSNELISKMGTNKYLRIQTLEAHTKLLIKDVNLSNFTTIKNPKGFMYCLVEVPSEWRTIYKKDLLQDNFKIIEKKVIEHSKIRKTYVKRKPNQLKTNQLFFKSGNWSEPKVANRSMCDGMLFIYTVKKELINLGYSLNLDNELDENTKKAIVDFQKKNNLKEGQLNIETLKKLGIDY